MRFFLLVLVAGTTIEAADKIDAKNLATGQAAFADSRSLKPGNFRKLTPADLPQPFATRSATNFPRVVPRPADAWPKAPEGFKVELYVTGLSEPREIRTAPNGDFFVVESDAGEIKLFLRDPKEEIRLLPGETYSIAPRRPHLVVNSGAASAIFFLLQGIGAYDFVRLP